MLERDLKAILYRGLNSDLQVRYQNAGELLVDLQNALDCKPLIREQNKEANVKRWVLRNPVIAGLVVLMCLLAVFSSHRIWHQYQSLALEQQSSEATLKELSRLMGEKRRSGAQITADQLAVEASSRIMSSLPSNSSLKFELAMILGQSMIERGQCTQALEPAQYAHQHGQSQLVYDAPERIAATLLYVEALQCQQSFENRQQSFAILKSVQSVLDNSLLHKTPANLAELKSHLVSLSLVAEESIYTGMSDYRASYWQAWDLLLTAYESPLWQDLKLKQKGELVHYLSVELPERLNKLVVNWADTGASHQAASHASARFKRSGLQLSEELALQAQGSEGEQLDQADIIKLQQGLQALLGLLNAN
ncbi:hypothetical protein [Agarivorans gilvus]|nr:hypothetical protein [Agarivorans gilvus]